MGSPNQKPVCQVCEHPCQIAGAGKYPGARKKAANGGLLTQADGLLPENSCAKTKTRVPSFFFARGAGHAPARATRPRSRSRGERNRLSTPRFARRSAPRASEAGHAFRDVPKAARRETPKHPLAMVHQYPNQEVVDGTAALAGVPVMSVADAKRNVEPRTHLAKVAFDIRDSAVDAHQGTRVTTVTHARCWHFVGFRPRPKNPPFRVVRLTTAPLARSVDLAAAERPNALRTDAHAATCAAAAHRRARDARVVVPRARAGSTFSTSGLFIPEISNPRPFVCSPPRLSPRAGRAAGEPVKREGSAEASHAVRPRRTRELSLSRSRRRGRLGPPRSFVGPKQPYTLRAIRCARVACVFPFRAPKSDFFRAFDSQTRSRNQNARRTIYEQSYARARSRAHALTPLLPSTPSPEP